MWCPEDACPSRTNVTHWSSCWCRGVSANREPNIIKIKNLMDSFINCVIYLIDFTRFAMVLLMSKAACLQGGLSSSALETFVWWSPSRTLRHSVADSATAEPTYPPSKAKTTFWMKMLNCLLTLKIDLLFPRIIEPVTKSLQQSMLEKLCNLQYLEDDHQPHRIQQIQELFQDWTSVK